MTDYSELLITSSFHCVAKTDILLWLLELMKLMIMELHMAGCPFTVTETCF